LWMWHDDPAAVLLHVVPVAPLRPWIRRHAQITANATVSRPAQVGRGGPRSLVSELPPMGELLSERRVDESKHKPARDLYITRYIEPSADWLPGGRFLKRLTGNSAT
jgi:hypothetical protein